MVDKLVAGRRTKQEHQSDFVTCTAPWFRGVVVCGSCRAGGLALLVRACLRWFTALVSDCVCMPNHTVALHVCQTVAEAVVQ